MSKIFVLGMHRSGTSAVTGLLRLAGASLGADNPDLVGADWSNPKGHWERRDVVRLNDKILAEHGFSWDKPGVVTETSYSDEIRAILDKMGPEPWVIKDPRMCLTFECWKRESGEPSIVLTHRDLYEIANSLKARNGFEEEKSFDLIQAYLLALRLPRKPDALIVYKDLISDPIVTTGRMVKAIPDLTMPDRGAIYEFIDPDISPL